MRPATVVWESHDPVLHNTLKVKVSSDRSAALSLRNTMGKYGSYVFGVGINGVGTENKINFGVLVDLNVWIMNVILFMIILIDIVLKN